ncbi:MAG: GreA/GreB family elongation factor [Motiliproteus sp.]|nr:GreA/GreB family elongation factor [Motiliproteus sp.]
MNAVNDAHKNATHSESKAENKYDTRGLEAAYLAHGLSNRVQQLQDSLASFGQLSDRNFSEEDSIQVGALVLLEDDKEQLRSLFLSPTAGGLKLDWQDQQVTLVSITAPLGKALMGHYEGDEIKLTINGTTQQYCINKVR